MSETKRKRGRPKKVEQNKGPVSLYEIKLHNAGRVYESTGVSLDDAFSGISLRTVRGASILIVTRDKKTREKILPDRVAESVFGSQVSGTRKNMYTHNLKQMFNDFA